MFWEIRRESVYLNSSSHSSICSWWAQQGNRPLIDLLTLLLYDEQGKHSGPVVYSKTISSMEMGCVQLNTVINYWFTSYRTLRPLYQQAQTFSSNIWGILNQNITLWTFLQYKNDNQCAEVSFNKLSQPSRPSANDQCTQGTDTQCVHRWEREAVSLLNQAQVIYQIQSGKVQVWDEQRSVYCIVP